MCINCLQINNNNRKYVIHTFLTRHAFFLSDQQRTVEHSFLQSTKTINILNSKFRMLLIVHLFGSLLRLLPYGGRYDRNPGVDNTARDDKGGQGGSGNTGHINLTKSNYR